MPPVAKQKMARTHQDSLTVVCAACWRKNKNVRMVTDKTADLICQFVFDGYSRSNGFHPTVLCDGCRKTLSDLGKVETVFTPGDLHVFI